MMNPSDASDLAKVPSEHTVAPEAVRAFGAMCGRLVIPDGFHAPLPDAELDAWEAVESALLARDGSWPVS